MINVAHCSFKEKEIKTKKKETEWTQNAAREWGLTVAAAEQPEFCFVCILFS